MLIAIIISCFNTYLEQPKFSVITFLIYTLLCVRFETLLIFLPLVLYDVGFTTYWRYALFMIIPYTVHIEAFHPELLSYQFLILCLALFSRYKTIILNKQKTEYKELRDTTKEVSLLLEEKNRNLLEKQDFEINLATLNERNRISKEIHDNIGHLLSRSLLQIGALLIITKEDITKNELSNLKKSISEGMDSIRASIHNMHNESIDLYSNLDKLIKDFTFCAVNFHYEVTSTPPTNMKYCIIAVIKETLSNVMKHSNATKVIIQVTEHPIMYQIIISDNGSIDDDTKILINNLNNDISMNEGMGLSSIVERVRGFEGRYHFSTNNGFQLFMTLPKKIN
jgi:signal transduction histidine kinase